jgi:tryptophan halogenase
VIKDICIVGGGTSGIVSALILKYSNTNVNVKLIKSKDIDIVGVGEGSTEHWAEFCKYADIDIKDLFKEAGSTYKFGIMFENWNGDDKNYYHQINSYFTEETPNGYPYIQHKLIAEIENQIDSLDQSSVRSEHYYPVDQSTNQFHFDTFKLNEFLLKKCKSRGIEVITDTITDVIIDDSGIKSLVGETNSYNSELYIDSSGFKKLLINKLGAEWIDNTDYLPMNSAITFPLPHDGKDFPAYTRAIAMDAGWMWQIPTQERFGNGYVFCDKFISEEDAIKEVEKRLGHKINVVKRFKFGAGYLSNPWIKNCVAVGLSSSFIEPLEATNIGTAIQQAFGIVAYLNNHSISKLSIDHYNKTFTKVFQNIVDFVQLHYLTKRTDTDFWKHCQSLPLTKFNKETLEHFKENIPLWNYFKEPYTLFDHNNWIAVMYGLGQIDRQKYIDNWKEIPYNIQMGAKVKIDVYNSNNADTVSHDTAIRIMRGESV